MERTERIRKVAWSIAWVVGVSIVVVTYLLVVPAIDPEWAAYERGAVRMGALLPGLEIGVPLYVAIGLGAEIAVAVQRHRAPERVPLERAVDWIDGRSTVRERVMIPPPQDDA